MLAYQDERADLAHADETTELLTALVWIADRRLATAYQKGGEPSRLAHAAYHPFRLPNDALLEGVRRAVPDGVVAARRDRAAAVRLGQIMTRLRFHSVRATGSDRNRGWELNSARARAYGVPEQLISDIPDILPTMTDSPT